MKKENTFLKVLPLLFAIFLLAYPQESSANEWEDYQQGVELMEKGKYNEAIIKLERAAKVAPKASTYRKLAISYEKTNQFQKAAETYYLEADIFRNLGYLDTYNAVKSKGDALYTEIDLFISEEVQLPKQQLGKYEPTSGMYVGAYIEQETNSVNKYRDFNSVTGKDHAVYFKYLNYGLPFPAEFAKQVKEVGGSIQIAFEPEEGLNAVKDNEYLRQFARDANDSGIPVFLRYASEMNGEWVPWNGDPELYKQKFSLVAKVMKEEAPNVAMAWVPNSVPEKNIDAYYPGDDVVDWVGMNLYSVPFFNGDPNKPAEDVNPLDLVDDFYQKYASKKPMMIGEYAASHFSSVGNTDVTKFGTTKLLMFYHGLQMKYPNIKAVHWFNVDTINGNNINHGRRLNNFNLLRNNQMLSAYKKMLKQPYFLSEVVNGPNVDGEDALLNTSSLLQGSSLFHSVNGLGFIKTYDPYINKVVYELNGKLLSESKQYPFEFYLDHAKLQKGTNKLVVTAYDSKGKAAGKKAVSFKKGPDIIKANKNTLNLFIDEKTVFNEKGSLQLLAPVSFKEGRSFVPLRFISETLGAKVGWNEKTKQITISNGEDSLVLNEGIKKVKVNNRYQTIDAAPEIRNGTTFIPIRFVTENLGAQVNYYEATKEIEIIF